MDLFNNPANAVFSPCRIYRYELWRRWGYGGYAMFIGLNPSTADEIQDDPTVRRCIRYAKAWGFDALCMTNIFAYRATDPRDMKAASDPIGGTENDRTLLERASEAGVVVAAWGTHGTFNGRGEAVRALLRDCNLHYLRQTQDGHPSHPLYLPADLTPIQWGLK